MDAPVSPMPTPTAAPRWPSSIRDKVRGARGRKRAALALVAGMASVLALAPFFLSPVLLLTLPVLVWLLDGAASADSAQGGARTAFAVGWWFGFGYFLLGLFWIGEAFLVEPELFAWLLPFAVTLMPAGLALFWGAACAAATRFWRPGLSRILVLAVSLSVAEWLRGHILTGFPWNVLGYALAWPLTLMQGAGLVGIYGLTLLAVVTFTSPLVLAADASHEASAWRRWRAGAMLALLPATLLAIYGAVRLAEPVSTVPGVMLRIVQPSVAQRDKWRREKQREVFDDHLALSATDADGRKVGLDGITHVVWPEASMPFLPLDSPEALEEIGAMLAGRARLIAGALRVERASGSHDAAIPERATASLKVFNSLVVFGPGGKPEAVYDKIHLVPFGEYLPLQPLLEAIGLRQLTRLRGGFSAGSSPRPVLDIPGLVKAIGLVCYEAIFPGAIVQGSVRPGVLVNVTNDGWFGNTTGPRQHLHQARVRAVEEGLPLVRAANNGISAVIDPYGRVTHRIDLNVRGSVDAPLPATAARPPYGAFGDWAWLALAVLCALMALFVGRRMGNS